MHNSDLASQGIRCLLQLAGSPPAGARALDVARAEGISPEALEPVLAALEERGLVSSGESGRYRLARPPGEIHVRAAWTALGGHGRVAGIRGGITIAHLLALESRAFSSERVAHAA